MIFVPHFTKQIIAVCIQSCDWKETSTEEHSFKKERVHEFRSVCILLVYGFSETKYGI